jgi:hypothetical protein
MGWEMNKELKERRVRWSGNSFGLELPIMIIIGGQCRLVSRRLAEQIRDELTEVLEQHPVTSAQEGGGK